MTDLGNMDGYGLSDIGKVCAVNGDQFMIADLRKSMLIHQTSVSLGEQSPLFGDTLGHLLLVADGGGLTVDTQASTITVRTIAHYMLNMMPWFYRLGGQQEDDFLNELEAALAKCQERIQAVADTIHTLAQQLVESGVLPPYESTTSRLSGVLWNAIGGGLDDLNIVARFLQRVPGSAAAAEVAANREMATANVS
jgi:hypothetical protein